ncbi:MAG: glycosyl transferase family 39 [Geobacteraceae bacterium]|nr:glycosyl transferase family 39 [Geobacteraceae bacterium]
MWNNRKALFSLVFYFFLLLLPTPFLALQESTEARYGEIAREMLVSGNFLEPEFNGIAHFHKPPLTYWAMAAGMKVFGVNGFGVRFFGILAAALALFWLYRTALLLLQDEKKAFTALLVLASSFLFLAVSRTAETDIYLTCFVMGAQYYLFRQIYGVKSNWNTCLFAFFLGLGFLTKGPLVFLFTLLPYFAAKLFDIHHRRVFSVREILVGLGVFLAIVLPWFIAVIHEHPNLVRYFLETQTVERVATDRFRRSKPFWFYFVLFPATFFPAIVPFMRSILSLSQCGKKISILYLYTLIPFAVFTLSRSKMGPYLLPLYGVATIIAVHCFYTLRSKWDDRVAISVFFLIPPAIALSGLVYKPLAPLYPYLVVSSLAALIACIFLSRIVNGDRLIAAGALFLIGVSVLIYLLLPSLETAMKGYARMTAKINSIDPGRQEEVIVYKDFLPSVSFYRQKLAIMALGRKRELEFERNDSYKQWYLSSVDELKSRTKDMRRVFVVTRPSDIGGFEATTSFICTEIFEQRKHNAYHCSAH